MSMSPASPTCMMTSHALPPKPHPIASAFFNQHDNDLETTVLSDFSKRRSTVAYARNSLGWRTRYSSSALYPVSILPVEGRSRLKEEDGESISFHVRQVFPGKRSREKMNDNKNGGDATDEATLQQTQGDTVHEDDCEFGTGATVWPGSIVLLKYLEKLAHDPRQHNVLGGKNVIDLGSGTAITSIASALLGASVVVCTDGCDPVVDLARKNIHDAISLMDAGSELSPTLVDKTEEMNRGCYDFRGCKMSAQKYLWGEGMPMQQGESSLVDDVADQNSIRDNQRHIEPARTKVQSSEGTHFDIIIGADCIVPKLYPIEPLVDAIDELSSDETITFLSYEQRHYEHFDPAVEFRRLVDLRNLKVEVVPDEEMHPMYPASDIQIWKVTRNDNSAVNRPKKKMQNTCIDSGSNRSNHKSLLVGKNS